MELKIIRPVRLVKREQLCYQVIFTADAKDAKSFFVFFAVERTAKKKEYFS